MNPWLVCPSDAYTPDVDVSSMSCHETELPQAWEAVMPNYDGFAVYHNQFKLLKKNQRLDFYVEQIRDADKVFVNGHLIGEMGEFPPEFDKAVLYARAYPIPMQLLKINEVNKIEIWVFNDARSGGMANSQPYIAVHDEVVENITKNNTITLTIMVALLMIGIMHLIHYAFNQKLLPNFSFGMFSLVWVAYLWTYSGFASGSGLSMSLLFKLNVTLFFAIFILFPVFIIQFFNIRPPLMLKLILLITFLAIPVVMLLPEPGMAYVPLQVIEVLTIPTILMVSWLLYSAVKANKPYAKLMVSVLMVYIIFGSTDIWLDFFQVTDLGRQFLLGPWALLLLSLVVTMILAHKNRINHDQATMDALTNTLRLHVFVQQLNDLKARAEINGETVLIMMMDLDDFKLINDNLGHAEGNRVLQKTVTGIQRILKGHDLLGRYGGDEFCIACLLESKDLVQQRTHYIHLASQQPMVKLGHQVKQIRTTIGAFVSEVGDGMNAEAMLQKADAALLVGKEAGKGGVFGID
ncbi:GGDEF domain-containing protein [Marinicella rhabdoformis]|uniref:GGDEF domain-containing protein n=1 Tax=Marinicella rhabdoformis TaxID=2580566 RepID=UPI0015CF948E|nr:GGDEF domain-containing protein [Marinicella rhabdoformis]